MTEQIFYVYIYRDPDTKQPVYVGKGKNNRAYTHVNLSMRIAKNNRFYKYLRTLAQQNKEPLIEIHSENLSEDDAFSLEERLVKEYGRVGVDSNGILLNFCPGGMYSKLIEAKQKRSKYHKDLANLLVEDNRHPWQGIKPWNNNMCSKKSKNTWKIADQVYNYYLSNSTDGPLKIYTKLQKSSPDVEYSFSSMKTLVYLIRDGWEPTQDFDWIAFSSFPGTSVSPSNIFENPVLKFKAKQYRKRKPAWDSISATNNSLKVWKLADVAYKYFTENVDCSYTQLRNDLLIRSESSSLELPRNTCRKLLEKLRSNWNPNDDSDWLKFKAKP